MLKKVTKALTPKFILSKARAIKQALKQLEPMADRECTICGYRGPFNYYGRPVRIDALCPKCNSLERHRLLMLAIKNGDLLQLEQDELSVLHFAPEPVLELKFRARFKQYVTADLFNEADITLNIESMELPESSFDVVIANHVLEHVDDKRAAKEVARILKPKGVLICQVPIIEGWKDTYEDSQIITESDRWLHYGQGDHVRYYGADFRNRFLDHGLSFSNEITSEGKSVIDYGLIRGEKVFVFTKV